MIYDPFTSLGLHHFSFFFKKNLSSSAGVSLLPIKNFLDSDKQDTVERKNKGASQEL